MPAIRNKEDLCLAYERLSIFKEAGKGDCQKAAELKNQIRSYSKLPRCSHIVRDDGFDGYVKLIELPGDFDDFSREEATEWFDRNCTLGPICSPYDCTGKPFTVWFKVFRRRGHWFVYHAVSFDV